jgi:large subunit ribosomal protein L4
MTTIKTLNFPVKTSTGENSSDSVNLNLNVPDYYASETAIDKSNYIIFRSLSTQLNNQRQGTANTKTRAEVRGGGRKPWKQKGTGRARAGSKSSPLWKGGGVSFGPKPKTFDNKINRKEWRLSLRLLLAKKQNDILIINDLNLESSKTKSFLNILNSLNLNTNTSITIVVEKIETNLYYATRNLQKINLLEANKLNLKTLLLSKAIVITAQSLKIIEETYNV